MCRRQYLQQRLLVVQTRTIESRSSSTEDNLPAWQAEVRRGLAENYGEVEGGISDPAGTMFGYSVADSLGIVDGECQDISGMKQQVRFHVVPPGCAMPVSLHMHCYRDSLKDLVCCLLVHCAVQDLWCSFP